MPGVYRTERDVVELWRAWAVYRKSTFCSRCEQMKHCGRSSRGRWLCAECFDQSPEGDRAFRERRPR